MRDAKALTRELKTLRRLATTINPNYDKFTRVVRPALDEPRWVRAFWRELGAHITVEAYVYPPDHKKAKKIVQLLKLEVELEGVPREQLPRRARLIYWDWEHYYITDESDPTPDDPPVLVWGPGLDRADPVCPSFLTYATGAVLRVLMPPELEWLSRKPPTGVRPFPGLHPGVALEGEQICIPFGDDEAEVDPRWCRVTLPPRALALLKRR